MPVPAAEEPPACLSFLFGLVRATGTSVSLRFGGPVGGLEGIFSCSAARPVFIAPVDFPFEDSVVGERDSCISGLARSRDSVRSGSTASGAFSAVLPVDEIADACGGEADGDPEGDDESEAPAAVDTLAPFEKNADNNVCLPENSSQHLAASRGAAAVLSSVGRGITSLRWSFVPSSVVISSWRST